MIEHPRDIGHPFDTGDRDGIQLDFANAVRLVRTLAYLDWPDRVSELDVALRAALYARLCIDAVCRALFDPGDVTEAQGERFRDFGARAGSMITEILDGLTPGPELQGAEHAMISLACDDVARRRRAEDGMAERGAGLLQELCARFPAVALAILAQRPSDDAITFAARQGFLTALRGVP